MKTFKLEHYSKFSEYLEYSFDVSISDDGIVKIAAYITAPNITVDCAINDFKSVLDLLVSMYDYDLYDFDSEDDHRQSYSMSMNLTNHYINFTLYDWSFDSAKLVELFAFQLGYMVSYINLSSEPEDEDTDDCDEEGGDC